ncbi:NAD(P)/FAD-dependent oxidoreductase [Anaerorhabdus furcosa]|uniref:Glycerol-3-phosphate dehydrogenase n=1 Tax=Anaerorhabdus furcosa TaxID=118967 RepID=A0A1T4NKL7_9FIRM|nr:NAD(P)/FAD-dependent oxidoreductase [Anaerorhabdus furcosa]SJZ79809.1 glycerol-3-phosphate dehydrogenase [Anaerorhabdus furcosa]
MFDVIIIGSGIVGSLIARALSKYEINVVVLEKGNDVAIGATMANSAIIHSGHDPLDGTLKAKLNVEGNQMYESVCKELNCSFKRIGAYVLATSDEEVEQLLILYKRAKDRNIPCQLHDRKQIKQSEPNINDAVVQGLWLPTTGIIYPWEVAIRSMENAIENGVVLKLNEEVVGITHSDFYTVKTKQSEFHAKAIINTAGVYADEIYQLINPVIDFSITARKGEYFVLDHLNKPLVNHVIYPVPSSKGKGVLIVPTTHNNTLLGPTSFEIDDKSAINNTHAGLDYVRNQVGKLIDYIPFDKVIRTFAGNRPTGTTHDFIIEESKRFKDFYNVAAIESPGLASAPAIAKMVEELYLNNHPLKFKSDYNPYCRKQIVLSELSIEQRNEYVKKDARYGRIICRCEKITEGEIVDAIHRTCGATTIKGVKKRVRPGMGRCQGGFCEPLVLDILARELKKTKEEILLDDLGSNLLFERTKSHEKD